MVEPHQANVWSMRLQTCQVMAQIAGRTHATDEYDLDYDFFGIRYIGSLPSPIFYASFLFRLGSQVYSITGLDSTFCFSQGLYIVRFLHPAMLISFAFFWACGGFS